MEKATLNVQTRENTGKGAARSLRREGSLPAVIYKAGETTSLTINEKELMQLFKNTDGRLTLLNLQFQDNSTKLVLYKECQVHPVYGNVLHVDFQEVASDKEITLSVGVNLVGESIGVKRDDGILDHRLRQIEVICLPDNVPAHIDIDITDLEAGHSIHVSDITPPEGVNIIADPKEVVVAVIIPSVIEEEEEVEGEELAEGEEAAKGEEGEAKEDSSEKKKEDS